MNFILPLVTVLVWIAGITGWIMNLVVLWSMSFDHLTGPLVLRLAGVFIAPLGSILGLFF